MNMWKDIAIIALAVTCAVLLPLLLIAIRDANTSFAMLMRAEKERDECERFNRQFEAELKASIAENEQLTAECQRLSNYSVELLNARVRFEHEAIGLKIKLDEALMASSPGHARNH